MSWGTRSYGSKTWGGAVKAAVVTLALSGVVATGSVGSTKIGGNLGGVTATGSVGSVAVSVSNGESIRYATGVGATGSVGTVKVSVTGGTCALYPTGVSATGSVTTVRTSLNSVAPSVVTAGGVYYLYPDYPTSPQTLSFDGTGSNYLVVLLSSSYNPDPVITGITFNGVALTNRASCTLADYYYPTQAQIWTLAAPASGVHDLVISWTGYAGYGFAITSLGLSGVTAIDQAVTHSYTSSDGTNRPITVNSTVYDICAAVLTTPYTDLSPYAGQSAPSVFDDTGNYLRHRVNTKIGAASSTTLGWTEASAYTTTMAAISLTGVGPAVCTMALSGNIGTGSVGVVTPSPSKAISGNIGTGVVGTVTASIVYGSELVGNSATTSVGTLTATVGGGTVTVALTGNIGTAVIGSVTAIRSIALTGNTSTGSVGSVGYSIGGSAALTGNIATTAVGSLTKTSQKVLTGVTGTGLVGSFGYSTSCTLALTGVNGFGLVGNVTPPVHLLEGAWQRASGHKTRAD